MEKKSTTLTDTHIILLHGLGRNRRMMAKMMRYFKAQHISVDNIDYPSTLYSVEELGERYLHVALQKPEAKNAKQVHFIAHSMGGILVRYYLSRHRLDNIGRVVMIAPPNQGSHVAEYFRPWRLYRFLFGPAGQQLGIGRESLPQKLGAFTSAEVGVITGNRCYNPILGMLMPSPSDGKVSVEAAKVTGMRDFLVVPCGHTYIVNNNEVIKQTAYFLQNGQFQHT